MTPLLFNIPVKADLKRALEVEFSIWATAGTHMLRGVNLARGLKYVVVYLVE